MNRTRPAARRSNMQGTKNRSTYLQQPPRPRGLCSNAEKPDVAFLKKKYIRPPALRRKRIWDLLLAEIGSRTRKRPLPPVLIRGWTADLGWSSAPRVHERAVRRLVTSR